MAQSVTDAVLRGLEPDRFQRQAFGAIDRGHSVLVAAPTSSGKTLVAEYAAERCLAAGRRVAYTTPIKALSNQKRRDLRALFNFDVGLLTGDNVVFPEAPVVVMTTEVLRNMIYAEAPLLDELGVVVLDEVHYLQDPYRGSVWEEVIIGLPEQVRLVCLSATATNAHELANWISNVSSPCEVVVETKRPVELHEHFLIYDKAVHQLRDFPTLSGKPPNQQPNNDVRRFLLQTQAGFRGGPRPARPQRLEVLDHLSRNNRLPAIVFIFSRQGCEDAVRSCLEQGMRLVDPTASRQIQAIVAQHVGDISSSDLKALQYDRWLEGLQIGVAAHHAGMVPPFKEAVEDCFAAGLLGAVFATETLALGLNMPARSVVVEQISRFKGEGFVMLTAGEYTQLTGRAGRRGIDTVGHAYTLWNPYDSFEQTAELVAGSDFEISSSFRPTFNMAANLISNCDDRQVAMELLSRSFAQFRADGRTPEWEAELAERKEELKQARRHLRRVGGGSNSTKKKRPHHKRESRVVRDARRAVEVSEAGVNALQGRMALAHGGLSRAFDAVTQLLEEFGCAQGWSLTPGGQILKQIFHESDLATVLVLQAGLLDEVKPAEMAGLVSCLTYEHRSRTDPAPPRFPSRTMQNKAARIDQVIAELNQRENAVGLSETPHSDPSFVECAFGWAAGVSLQEILSGSESVLGSQLTPGDFVRQIRNLSDLLRQISKVAPRSATRRCAAEAMTLLERDIVEAASMGATR